MKWASHKSQFYFHIAVIIWRFSLMELSLLVDNGMSTYNDIFNEDINSRRTLNENN